MGGDGRRALADRLLPAQGMSRGREPSPPVPAPTGRPGAARAGGAARWPRAALLLTLGAASLPACTGAQVGPGGSSDAPASTSVTPEAAAAAADSPRHRVAALAELAAQGDAAAREELRALAVVEPGGPVAEHAALALGAALLEEGQREEALPHLRRASRGGVVPAYARVLLARAVLEDPGAKGAPVQEALELLRPVPGHAETPGLAGAARLRLLQLASRAGEWAEAASWGRGLLADEAAVDPAILDEARWLTAESLRLAGERDASVEVYRRIWRETPGSPWGTKARERLAAAGVDAAPAAPAERLAWIEQLQKVGLHREALEALAPLLGAAADDETRSRATQLAARSHFVLRENERVVERAESLRRRAPDSTWAALAALEAMRALGRGDHIAEVRRWEAWLRERHPRTPTAHEARYYLGSVVGAAEGEERGIALLREVAASDGPRAPDALWRIAWLERRRGRDAAAREGLERLLERHPESGYLAAALYWLARLAGEPDGARARELYRRVREEFPRDYYGRRAAERLEQLGERLRPLEGSGAGPAVDPLTDPARRPEPAYRKAVELRRIGLPGLAALELATLPTESDPALHLARLHLLARAGDTWNAIAGLIASPAVKITAQPLGDPDVPAQVWETLYPYPYRAAFAAAARRRAPSSHPFDAWLLAALSRRESRIWPRAVSGAGAVGLMQLTPDTAARVARTIGREPPGREGLFDPAVNLELGAAYLASLVEQFGGEWAPAIASYNAGEHVVRGWWAARPAGQSIDEWIENIPYVETRLYVKAILGDYQNYRELYPQAMAGGASASGR